MQEDRKPIPANQSGDFYVNADGLLVFTAQYHLRRGYCCGNDCKHCPYEDEDEDEGED